MYSYKLSLPIFKLRVTERAHRGRMHNEAIILNQISFSCCQRPIWNYHEEKYSCFTYDTKKRQKGQMQLNQQQVDCVEFFLRTTGLPIFIICN